MSDQTFSSMDRRRFLRQGGRMAAGVLLAGTPFRLGGEIGSGPAAPACVERLYLALGTVVRFQVYHEDAAAAHAAVAEAATLVQRIHNLMSVQDPASELSAWNRSAHGLDRPFDPLTAAALDEALRYAAYTDGRLDPTVGAAVQALAAGRPPVPQPDRLGAWDAAHRRFRKPHPGVMLDLGGTAKGWAVDRAVDVLVRAGVTAALINAGGDLRVCGAPPGAPAWSIGLRDPRDPDGLLGTVELKDAAVATSGDYEPDGSTLVDPRDLSRVRFSGSVSVVAPTCGTADCLSTALSVEPDLRLLPPGAQAVVAHRLKDGLALTASPTLPWRRA